jgi:hypothetical protein
MRLLLSTYCPNSDPNGGTKFNALPHDPSWCYTWVYPRTVHNKIPFAFLVTCRALRSFVESKVLIIKILPSGSKVISGGQTDRQTQKDRQTGDLISLLSFLESRLEMYISSVDTTLDYF